jgi:hypothetical protein
MIHTVEYLWLLSDDKGVFGFIAFMRLVHELLNDVSVDMNIDVTHAESQTHNRHTKAQKRP